MVIKDGKIISATESELYAYWLEREYDEIYTFPDYLRRMKEIGVEVTEEDK